MRVPKWAIPLFLRLLSLSGLASASGTPSDLRVGFALAASPAEAFSQPRLENLSLDLDFFIQVANHELKVPIMPL